MLRLVRFCALLATAATITTVAETPAAAGTPKTRIAPSPPQNVLLAKGTKGTPRRVSPRDKKKAKKLFRRGRKLYARSRYEKAAAVFLKAYKLWPKKAILFNMAVAYALAKDYVAAARHTREYLKRATPKEEKELPDVLQKALQQVGILTIHVPSSRAAIFIDGRMVGHGHVELVVKPGEKAIDVRLDDRIIARKVVQVRGGKEKSWELASIPEPRPQKKPTDRTKPRLAATDPTDDKAQTALSTPTVRKTSGLGRLHWGYFAGAAGLTAAALTAAVVMHLQTNRLRDDFKQDRSNESLRDDGITYYYTSNALWGVTAAAAAGTIALAIFTRWSKGPQPKEKPQAETDAVSVDAAFSPTSAKLVVKW